MSSLLPEGIDPRYEAWIELALEQARAAAQAGDVPVGAVIVAADGTVLAEAGNRREQDADPLAHAEVLALRAAAQVARRWRLDDCTLVVTLEPCAMCTGAALQARIGRIVLGAWDPKAGACGSVWDLARDRRSPHRIEVVGAVRESDCAELLRAFFRARRA